MQQQLIDCVDTIWKFHVNPENSKLYLECKTENNEFYLWDYSDDKKWYYPAMDKHTTNSIQLQYPFLLLNYLNTDNLIQSSTLACFHLEKNELHWASSEYKLERCYDGIIQVFNAKIIPKRTEYLDYNKNSVKPEELKELKLDFQFAELQEGVFVLNYNENVYQLKYNEVKECLELNAIEQGNIIWEAMEAGIDYKQEYDYLMRIGNKIVFMLDKHRIIILQ